MQDLMNSLSIKLDDVPSNPVFIGEKSRLSSATSVCFLDENTIACAHFSAMKIYVYRFDINNNIYERISEIDTTYNGVKCRTDLMAYDGFRRIAVSNFFDGTCTVYNYDGNEITLSHYIPYNAGDVVHGIKFYSKDVLAMTSRRKRSGVHFFGIYDGIPVGILGTDRKSVQDFCLISKNQLAMISTTGSPKMQSHEEMWGSNIDIIDFDFERGTSDVRRSFNISHAHTDNVIFHNSKLYMSDQYNNEILVFDYKNLNLIRKYEGFDFPHGVDVREGMLAVSNYGSNRIEIRMI